MSGKFQEVGKNVLGDAKGVFMMTVEVVQPHYQNCEDRPHYVVSQGVSCQVVGNNVYMMHCTVHGELYNLVQS